jgi:hypothetical protein
LVKLLGCTLVFQNSKDGTAIVAPDKHYGPLQIANFARVSSEGRGRILAESAHRLSHSFLIVASCTSGIGGDKFEFEMGPQFQ